VAPAEAQARLAAVCRTRSCLTRSSRSSSLAQRVASRPLPSGYPSAAEGQLNACLPTRTSCGRWRQPADLAAAARANLARCGIDNAHVVVADGTRGLPDQAPFEAVVVSAAFPSVPAPLSQQLAAGGRLVQPIGPGGREEVALFVEEQGLLRRVALVTTAH